MSAVISAEEPVRGVSGVEALLARHSEHKAEIDARQDTMGQLIKAGRKLIQQGHYSSAEVCVCVCVHVCVCVYVSMFIQWQG